MKASKSNADRQAVYRARLAAMSPIEKVRHRLEVQKIYSQPPAPIYTPAEEEQVAAIRTYLKEAQLAAEAVNTSVKARMARRDPEIHSPEQILEAEAILVELFRFTRINLPTY